MKITSKKIIIFVFVIAVSFAVLFVLTRPKYIFDFEGRVKLLEQISKTQEEYPNAKVLIADVSPKLPKAVPVELTYPKAKLASLEQLSSQGISYVLISSDPMGEINKTMGSAIEKAGWELIVKTENIIEAKKGLQRTKISLEKEDGQTLIIVAYTYDL